eukprot:1904855-Amphidinium_carterae.1
MATPEQIQELVTRIQAMEARELENGRRDQGSESYDAAYGGTTSWRCNAGRWYFSRWRGHRGYKIVGKT